MASFKMNLFNNVFSKEYINDFNHQIKCVKDSFITFEEAIKLFEKDCIPEMEDKCKIVMELEKEGKSYEDRLKQSLDKALLLGPNGTKYGEISSIMGDIGQKAKFASELLISIKEEKIPKELIKDLIKLVETNESITREIYLKMRKIEDIENENINRFSKKILKKKNEAEELSDLLSNKYIKQVQDDNLSKSIESIISTLKKIPEDAENLALIINRQL
ncbi:MAG: hypothetical protein AMQ22_01399 [Candidatus Methanofastidiosum methylothiophilum]|uniref:PhoU domain protein n=1 Tax=Candidatus Methanofastidiosum methylothiophilum TaxID=1705564 RepID=A0A150J0N8_9EURY|nr:MAG: hypothetical protein AMQ22_01399 [Candidatus Methanofastidiosum methylthiophilus]